MKLDRHIFLIGFMGSGKTTIGKLIATELNIPFIDTDELIEFQTQQTIPEIFATVGEQQFRKIEKQVIASLAQYPPAIIALGGGAVISEDNRNVIKELGYSIYLKWSPQTLQQRLLSSKNRPLVKDVKPAELLIHISKMLAHRKQFYEQADIIIDGNSLNDLNSIKNKIIYQLERLWKK